jgi:hypothetical protein
LPSVTVGLAVHVTVETPARRRRGDELPAGQQAGTPERAVAHGLPGLLRKQALRPYDADGGHPVAQVVAQFGLQEVGCDPRQRLLGALGHAGDAARGVRVSVGQPGHLDPLAKLDGAGAVRARLAGVADPADDPVLDQDRRMLAQRRSGAVEQPGPGQPEPPLGRRRGREQRREPVRHVDTASTLVICGSTPEPL